MRCSAAAGQSLAVPTGDVVRTLSAATMPPPHPMDVEDPGKSVGIYQNSRYRFFMKW